MFPEGQPMARETPARTRLGDAMAKRAIELRLRWETIAKRAGISVAHLRNIRAGLVGASDVVYAQLEEVLQWAPGSIAAIQEGGEPAVANQTGPRTLGDLLIERGLARPEDLNLSDEIVNDPVAREILELDTSEETRNRLLVIYANMRRNVFETVLEEKRRKR
ncbi:hypothetical protein Aph01nite_43090 [Acrocarpospora phusangensis]|uniref:HTH cro/C1-type domain-containing protein n=2 Tax=Acrocarpospora phusangensis TaxID=1070424 RepID=A0A919ULH9_9ACTN|nr:hypothetical protein Aph01nite_43090 [Acrocarpospora phusangensis]